MRPARNGGRYDKPYFAALFAGMAEGSFGGLGKGVLNPHRLVVAGYSVGAQMVSWFFQLQATGQLPDATIKVGGLLHHCTLYASRR